MASESFCCRHHVWGVFLPQSKALPELCSHGGGRMWWRREVVQVEICRAGQSLCLWGELRESWEFRPHVYLSRKRKSRCFCAGGWGSSQPFSPAPVCAVSWTRGRYCWVWRGDTLIDHMEGQWQSRPSDANVISDPCSLPDLVWQVDSHLCQKEMRELAA